MNSVTAYYKITTSIIAQINTIIVEPWAVAEVCFYAGPNAKQASMWRQDVMQISKSLGHSKKKILIVGKKKYTIFI
jgi:hypothetical protein